MKLKLHDTKWLASRLGISVSTIERLRAEGSNGIPKAVINKTIRYSEEYVAWWIQRMLEPTTPDYATWSHRSNSNPAACNDGALPPATNKPKIILRKKSDETSTN